MRSPGEALLEIHLGEIPGTTWTPEFQFDPARKWRADFCEVEKKIIVECEGGLYTGGRHVRGKGYEADLEKYNRATELGYKVLRFSVGGIMSGHAKHMIERVVFDL